MNKIQRRVGKVAVPCCIFGFVLFLALGILPAAAQSDKPVDRASQLSRVDKSAPFLSEILPASLAQFVVRVGSDHELVELNRSQLEGFEEEMSDLESLDPDAAAILDTLKPLRIFGVGESVTLSVLKLEPIAKSAGRNRAPTTSVVAATRIALDDGSELAFADNVPLEEMIREGAIVNAGDTDILVSTESDELVLAPGEALWVVSENDTRGSNGNGKSNSSFVLFAENVPAVGAGCSSCSVTCSAGGACCTHKTSITCAKCDCKAGSRLCDAGGTSATQCSVGAAAAAIP